MTIKELKLLWATNDFYIENKKKIIFFTRSIKWV